MSNLFRETGAFHIHGCDRLRAATRSLIRNRNRALAIFVLFDIVIAVFVTSAVITPSSGGLIRFSIRLSDNWLANLPLLIALLFIQIMLSYLVIFRVVRSKAERLTPALHAKPFGNYTGAWVDATVRELCDERGVHSISRIYILDQPVPNALTFDALPFPGVRRSWLVIFSNMFEILSPDELRAVIAHEIEHVRNHDSAYRLLVQQPYASIMLLFLLLQLQMLWIIIVQGSFGDRVIRLFDLILFSVAVSMVTGFGSRLSSRVNNAMELLADHGAAISVGVLPMINSLIKLGQRNEAFLAMTLRLKKLQKMLPSASASELKQLQEYAQKLLAKDAFDEQKAELVANRAFMNFYLQEFHRNYSASHSSSFNFDTDARRRAEALAEIVLSVARAESTTNPDRIDWREYDDHIRDFKLDREELVNLVRDLRDQTPNKPMFPLQEQLARRSRTLTHPFISNRLLQLYNDFYSDQITAHTESQTAPPA